MARVLFSFRIRLEMTNSSALSLHSISGDELLVIGVIYAWYSHYIPNLPHCSSFRAPFTSWKQSSPQGSHDLIWMDTGGKWPPEIQPRDGQRWQLRATILRTKSLMKSLTLKSGGIPIETLPQSAKEAVGSRKALLSNFQVYFAAAVDRHEISKRQWSVEQRHLPLKKSSFAEVAKNRILGRGSEFVAIPKY